MANGFTLIEILSIAVILVILFLAALPVFYNQKGQSSLDAAVSKMIAVLELARTKALASENESRWGVYFDNSSLPHYTLLFKGESYALRDSAFDQCYDLASGLALNNLSFYGGGQEVVFKPVSGQTDNFGDFSLDSGSAESRTIYISWAGLVSLEPLSTSDENRLKDSRHVHFSYSNPNPVDVLTDKLILTFEGGVSQEIILADNLSAGQIYWQGEVEVAGETQQIKIQTHYLNDPSQDTVFCIHRDRRFNSKILAIDLDSDLGASPNLIYYNADDETIKGNSIFVSDPIWQ